MRMKRAKHNRRHLNLERNDAIEWIKQLQEKGTSSSVLGDSSGSEMTERLGQDAVISDSGPFPIKNSELRKVIRNDDTHYFKPYVDVLVEKLNICLKRIDGKPSNLPVVDILPGPYFSPVQQRVFGATSEIILIPSELMHLSNLASRSISIILNPRKTKDGGIRIPSPSEINVSNKDRYSGLIFLFQIIFCHIAHGESFLAPLPPIGQRHEYFRSNLLESMEMFAIAHEYGHFIAEHAEWTLGDNSPICGLPPAIFHELEADAIGQSLCLSAGSKSNNPYLMCNVGAVVLLHIGEFIRQAKSILINGKNAVSSNSHPTLEDRLQSLQTMSLVNFCAPPPEAIAIQQNHWNTLMSNIWKELDKAFKTCYRDLGPLSIEK